MRSLSIEDGPESPGRWALPEVLHPPESPGFAQAALTHTLPHSSPTLPLQLPHSALTSLEPLSQSVSLSPVQRETGPHCLGCLLRPVAPKDFQNAQPVRPPWAGAFPRSCSQDPGWSEGPGTWLPATELSVPQARGPFLRPHFLSASCKTACFLLGRET